MPTATGSPPTRVHFDDERLRQRTDLPSIFFWKRLNYPLLPGLPSDKIESVLSLHIYSPAQGLENFPICLAHCLTLSHQKLKDIFTFGCGVFVKLSTMLRTIDAMPQNERLLLQSTEVSSRPPPEI